MRVADEDRQLSAKELENLILSKNREQLHWDREVSHLTITDIDEEKLKNFIDRAGLPWDSSSNSLEKLNLIEEGRLRNAARVFFAHDSDLQLRCAIFGGTNSATIIDRHDFDGDLLELIEEAQKYLLKNIHIGMRLQGLEREDVPEISIEAMREAIINSFCHRDYYDPDHIQIAIFKDRVEIRNPGGLLEGLTIEELKTGNISKRRNPLIAELLRRVHLVEAWGRGIPLIMEHEPGVEFKEIAKLFITSFNRPSFNGTTDKTTDKELLVTEKAILDLIATSPTITQKEMAEKLDMTTDGIRYNTDKLKLKGLLKRVGGKKNGYWEIYI
jgi:ATP-dependent DNA helicase RecG